MSAAASAALAGRLRTESIVWLTTVAPGGQPQSSPVWFLWDESEEELLAYAQPQSWKVRNIRANPLVSLHLNSDDEGGRVVTLEGSARICDGHVTGTRPATRFPPTWRSTVSGSRVPA